MRITVDPGRIIKVSELVSRIERPTAYEATELVGQKLAGDVFRWSQSNPDWLFYCPAAGWYEFSSSGDGMMASYFRCWPSSEKFRHWASGPESVQEHPGYFSLDCPHIGALASKPTLRSLATHFPPHVLDKILRHLDPATGDPTKGEVRCIGIRSIVWSRSLVQVFYATQRPDGVVGTKPMRFYNHRHVMRCLALTEVPAGEEQPYVQLVQEYRRGRGESILMCPSGGEDLPTLLEVLAAELRAETGSELLPTCPVYSIGRHYTDDGTSSDPVNLLVVEGLKPVPGHSNPAEGISRVVSMKWEDFIAWTQTEECEDMYSQLFARRCSWISSRQRLVVVRPCEKIQ